MTWDTNRAIPETLSTPEGSEATQEDNGVFKNPLELVNRLGQLWQLITRLLAEAESQGSVVILGNHYQLDSGEGPRIDQEVYKAVQKRFWMSYRLGFEPIKKHEDGPLPLAFVQSMIFNKNVGNTFANFHSLVDNDNFTTDVGWGCMIRTSQSVLANAMDQAGYEVNLALFADTQKAPFSLHNFVKAASDLPLRVRPGQWFGPSAASLSIKRLCDAWKNSVPDLLSVIVCESGDIYDDQIQEFPVLLLLPLRLGIDHINNVYQSSLFQLLDVPQSAGIAGGKPSSSLYFFGYQGSSLLYLDPHYPQSVEAGIPSYHSNLYQTLRIADMDPSMMAGLVLRSSSDYELLKSKLADNKIVHFHESLNLTDYVEVEKEDFVDLGVKSSDTAEEAYNESDSSMVIVD